MCLLILILSVLCTLWFGAIIIVSCATQIAFFFREGGGAASQGEQGQAGRAVDVVALNAFYLARVVAATNKRSQQRQQISYNDVNDKQASREREREREMGGERAEQAGAEWGQYLRIFAAHKQKTLKMKKLCQSCGKIILGCAFRIACSLWQKNEGKRRESGEEVMNRGEQGKATRIIRQDEMQIVKSQGNLME